MQGDHLLDDDDDDGLAFRVSSIEEVPDSMTFRVTLGKPLSFSFRFTSIFTFTG